MQNMILQKSVELILDRSFGEMTKQLNSSDMGGEQPAWQWRFQNISLEGFFNEFCGLSNFLIINLSIISTSKRIKDEKYYVYNIFPTLFQ